MIEDYVKTAYRDIRNRKKRSWLTMIGIIIGVAAVVSLISLGQGLEDAFNEQFEMMGANMIMIMPGSGLVSTGMSGSSLTNDDLELIKKVRGVNSAAGMISKISKVEFSGELKRTFVSGLPLDVDVIENIESFKVVGGRDLKKTDRNGILIGYNIAEGKFFKKKVLVGNIITVNDKKFKVVGTMEKIGNPQDDANVIMMQESAIELFDTEDLMTIMVDTKPGFEPDVVAENIKKALRKDRNQKVGEEDFTIQTAEQLKETFNSILNLIQSVLIGIAAISLLVGGIGIMNTMYTSVLERTRDIGVMKAIGAKNSNIMSIFLIESGMIGMTGGAIGVILGLSMSKAIEYLSSTQLGVDYLKASMAPEIILGALAFSFIVGMVSGTTPAIRAARLKPTDALRYE